MINNMGDLYHHGIPGQKWGIRRYQNKDGSLTPAGRKRANKLKQQYTELTGKRLVRKAVAKNQTQKIDPNKKSIKDMSDTELREKTNRMRLENDYVNTKRNNDSIHKEQVSAGRKIFNHIKDNVITPAATDAGRRVLTDWLTKTGRDALDLTTNKNPNAALKREVEGLELESRKLRALNNIDREKKKR